MTEHQRNSPCSKKNQADAFFCSRISDSRPCLNRTLR